MLSELDPLFEACNHCHMLVGREFSDEKSDVSSQMLCDLDGSYGMRPQLSCRNESLRIGPTMSLRDCCESGGKSDILGVKPVVTMIS